MRWSEIGEQTCSVARALSVVGDRWTMMVLRDSFLGTRRFADFQRHLGAARNLVADRLAKLVEHGILERRPYQDRPLRHEYVLTEKGLGLQPVLLSLVAWGDRWMDEAGQGPPIETVHTGCGEPMHLRAVCSECGEPLTAANVTPRLGAPLKELAKSTQAMKLAQLED
jgi:DNA-binding HxlR family transcriptional regulator